MANTLQFEDRKELEAWLQDKPVDWAQALSARTALRIFPLLFEIAAIPESKLAARLTQGLILAAWRATFISWAARTYPAHDMRATAATAAATAARAAARATADVATAATAAAAAARATAAIWGAVSADARVLHLSDRPDDAVSRLIAMPLWIEPIAESERFQTNSPEFTRRAFDRFANLDWVRGHRWEMITDWFVAVLPNDKTGKPHSLFGERADIEIATQPDKFWDRKPEEVLAAIGNIAGLKPETKTEWKMTSSVTEASTSNASGSKTAKKKDPAAPVTEDAEEDRAFREEVQTHSDEPTARDRLGRRPFAQALVERMDDVRQQGSPDGFAVHIHAPWGAGKTSILLMMEQVMTDATRPPEKQWTVVHFNAWKNERRKPPWWPLIQQTYASCRDTLRRKGKWFRWLSVKSCWISWRLRADWFPYMVAALAFSAILYFWWSSNSTPGTEPGAGWSGLIHQPGSWSVSGSPTVIPEPEAPARLLPALTAENVEKILKIVVAFAAAFAAFVGVGRAIVFGSPNNAKFYSDLSSDPLKRITRLFRAIVRRSKRPVAIFIDDLDRCDADYVVDLLEGIQTLFRGRDVAYVVAADRGWIKAAFEQRYGHFAKDVGDPGQPLGYLFLEKIFQISSPVPGMGVQIRQEYWSVLIDGEQSISARGQSGGRQAAATGEAQEDVAEREFDRRVADVRRQINERADGEVTSSKVEEFLTKMGASAENRAAAALEINSSAAAEKEAEHLLSGFRDVVGEVPRVMKRMINAFGMRRAVGILEGSKVPQQALVRWTILEQRWPALADLLVRNPEWASLIAMQQRDEDLKKLDPALQPFANRHAVQAVLGKDEDGDLTPELISTIARGSGYDAAYGGQSAEEGSTRLPA